MKSLACAFEPRWEQKGSLPSCGGNTGHPPWAEFGGRTRKDLELGQKHGHILGEFTVGGEEGTAHTLDDGWKTSRDGAQAMSRVRELDIPGSFRGLALMLGRDLGTWEVGHSPRGHLSRGMELSLGVPGRSSV